ncbi:MAG: hypothetical protein HYZ28_11040 [Myxococcales bacterium]|nr:hypothetical protein [Myxococcales bacterium]
MKCRVWRKLHAEEAKRFDEVYGLMEKHEGLSLEDGFGAVQSGLSVEEFLARKSRTQKKAAVKEARASVPTEAVNAFIDGLVRERVELSVVLAERTLIDVVTGVEPVAFQLEKTGRMEKLQVVLLAPRIGWEQLVPTLERDQKLLQKPSPIARLPDKRPVSDPRPFLPCVGQKLDLLLRNGLRLRQLLTRVGPFDVVLGTSACEMFVPLHAIVRWSKDE